VASILWQALEAGGGGAGAAPCRRARHARQGLMDSARHVMGCLLYQVTRVYYAFDDVASTIHQSLARGKKPSDTWGGVAWERGGGGGGGGGGGEPAMVGRCRLTPS